MTEDKKPSGPDLTKGVSLAAFKDGKLLPPELAEVIDGCCVFRGEVVA